MNVCNTHGEEIHTTMALANRNTASNGQSEVASATAIDCGVSVESFAMHEHISSIFLSLVGSSIIIM